MLIEYRITKADAISGDITIEYTTSDYPDLPPVIQTLQVPLVNDMLVSSQELHIKIMEIAPADFFYRMVRMKQNMTTKDTIEAFVGMTGSGEKYPDLTREWLTPTGI